jgi:hypothetical protein
MSTDPIDPVETIRAIFDETTAAHQRFSGYGFAGVVAAAAAIARCVASGRKVLAFGNGGSASMRSTSSPSWWVASKVSAGRCPGSR